MEVTFQSRAASGETVCGDMAQYWWRADGQLLLCLCDGLGHGTCALEAARACMLTVTHCQNETLSTLINRCNEALRSTRGAAVGLSLIDMTRQRMEFVGVGNIRCCLLNDDTHAVLPSMAGILGSSQQLMLTHRTAVFVPGDSAIFLYSDGVRDAMTGASLVHHRLYPDLSLMLTDIIEQWGGSDDVAVLAAR